MVCADREVVFMDMRYVDGIRDVHRMVQQAAEAYQKLKHYSQEEIDRVVGAMAQAAWDSSEHLARLAAGETGMGRVESKIAKNRFAAGDVYQSIKDMKTTGVIRYDEQRNCYEIAEPVGVVAAIIPTTNPTSTVIFKALISIKSRNSVVFAPHPKAVRCIAEAVKVMKNAAIRAGAPEGCLECLIDVSLPATQELMKHPDVNFILATGGPGLVKAAYQSGKPAIGVGQGNTPAYIDRSANVAHAVRCIVESQMFDFGTICSSEQSVVVDAPVYDSVVAEFRRNKAYFLSEEEVVRLSAVVIQNDRMNPEIVGRPAFQIAKQARISVPSNTSVLLAPLHGVGKDYPLSKEKLAPVLAFYRVKNWEQGCSICTELLHFEGMGHSLAVHATNTDVIMEFGLQKPTSRILVNTPTAQGGVGLATGLVPSMTLGCGTQGGNITSDNISAHHLFNIKRVVAIRKDFPLWEKPRSVDVALTKLEIQETATTTGHAEVAPFAVRTSPAQHQKVTPFALQPMSVSPKTIEKSSANTVVWPIRSKGMPLSSNQVKRVDWP